MLEWITVEIALETGLRISEIAGLACGDLWLRTDGGSVLVRHGKGGSSRVVKFGARLSRSLGEYLHWKDAGEEPRDTDDPLIRSSRTGKAVTTRCLRAMFARVAEQAGVVPVVSLLQQHPVTLWAQATRTPVHVA